MNPNNTQLALNEINQLISQISNINLVLILFAYFGALFVVLVFVCLLPTLLSEGFSDKKSITTASVLIIGLTAGFYLSFSFNIEEKPRLVCRDYHYKKSELLGNLKMTDRPIFLPDFKYISEEKMIANIHQLTEKSKKQLTESIKANVIASPNADRQKIIIKEACQLRSSLEAKQFNNKIQNNVESFINQLSNDGVQSAQKLESLK